MIQLIMYAAASVFLSGSRPGLRIEAAHPTCSAEISFLSSFRLIAMTAGLRAFSISEVPLFPQAAFCLRRGLRVVVGTGASDGLYAGRARDSARDSGEIPLSRILTAEYEVRRGAVRYSPHFLAVRHAASVIHEISVYLLAGSACATLYATRSIRAPILVHIANNLIAAF